MNNYISTHCIANIPWLSPHFLYLVIKSYHFLIIIHFLSIFQQTIYKNIINLHIDNNMMYTSNYQWKTISTFTVIDNFQFLSAYLILCILVEYVIPWSYTIPFITFTICIKTIVVHQWIYSMPIVTPGPFPWPLP